MCLSFQAPVPTFPASTKGLSPYGGHSERLVTREIPRDPRDLIGTARPGPGERQPANFPLTGFAFDKQVKAVRLAPALIGKVIGWSILVEGDDQVFHRFVVHLCLDVVVRIELMFDAENAMFRFRH